MAPVIWGLDLKEMQWSKFKSGYMWNTDYHLRRTKFIVYQLAMILCVVSESLGTAVLSDYLNEQKFIEGKQPGTHVHNNDYIGAASYNIFVGIWVAFIFGSAFFFDLFWPERREIKGVRKAWRITSVMSCAFTLSSAIVFTVITATRRVHVEGVSYARAEVLASQWPKRKSNPFEYRKNPRAVASIVFLWIGTIFTWISTIILYLSLSHDEKVGPKSGHARDAEKASVASESVTTEPNAPSAEPTVPPAAAARGPSPATDVDGTTMASDRGVRSMDVDKEHESGVRNGSPLQSHPPAAQ
ncbi:hypothetical protein IWZ00DRAFT_11516 [Phyllosticta capitalensis]|uniref:uncharacterized protein n=1 Tax=Phyllosticta capitalensis TaxID=121624 RepID=UPI00313107DB